jgi:hypothetical protein
MGFHRDLMITKCDLMVLQFDFMGFYGETIGIETTKMGTSMGITIGSYPVIKHGI